MDPLLDWLAIVDSDRRLHDMGLKNWTLVAEEIEEIEQDLKRVSFVLDESCFPIRREACITAMLGFLWKKKRVEEQSIETRDIIVAWIYKL